MQDLHAVLALHVITRGLKTELVVTRCYTRHVSECTLIQNLSIDSTSCSKFFILFFGTVFSKTKI